MIADLRSGDLSNPCNRTEIPLSRQGILLLVCDGMGGAAAGDLAARIASDAIKQQLVGAGPEVAEHPNESLTNAVWGANGAVLAEAKAHPETRGMGTTCTAAIVLPDRLFIAQIGDSRAYLLHDGRLQLLTRDQTMADEMVEAGALRPEDVATYPYRHILLQAVGTRSTIEPSHLGGARRSGRSDPALLGRSARPGSRPGDSANPRCQRGHQPRRARVDSGGPGCGRAGQRDGRRGGLRIGQGAGCRRWLLYAWRMRPSALARSWCHRRFRALLATRTACRTRGGDIVCAERRPFPIVTAASVCTGARIRKSVPSTGCSSE